MPQPQTLEDIFGAFVNQGTLEEAAVLMAELTRTYPDLRAEFVSCLSCGIRDAANGDSQIVDAVNNSGYRVSTPKDAGAYCSDLLSFYIAALNYHIGMR